MSASETSTVLLLKRIPSDKSSNHSTIAPSEDYQLVSYGDYTDKLILKSLSVSRKPIKCTNEFLADALARDRIMLSFELIVNGRQAGESTF